MKYFDDVVEYYTKIIIIEVKWPYDSVRMERKKNGNNKASQ